MNKNMKVKGTLTIEVPVTIEIPESWNYNEIEDYLKRHYEDYLDDVEVHYEIEDEEEITEEEVRSIEYFEAYKEGLNE